MVPYLLLNLALGGQDLAQPALDIFYKYVERALTSRAIRKVLENEMAFDRIIEGNDLKKLVWMTCKVSPTDPLWKDVNWILIPRKPVRLPGLKPLIMIENFGGYHSAYYSQDGKISVQNGISSDLLKGNWFLQISSIYIGFIKNESASNVKRKISLQEQIRFAYLFGETGIECDRPEKLGALATLSNANDSVQFCEDGIIEIRKRTFRLDFITWSVVGRELGVLK